jgi:hypothetical protein
MCNLLPYGCARRHDSSLHKTRETVDSALPAEVDPVGFATRASGRQLAGDVGHLRRSLLLIRHAVDFGEGSNTAGYAESFGITAALYPLMRPRGGVSGPAWQASRASSG